MLVLINFTIPLPKWARVPQRGVANPGPVFERNAVRIKENEEGKTTCCVMMNYG
jgi:hypothetical protein